MAKYKIIDEIYKKLGTKGRLVKAFFDMNTGELVLQINRNYIAGGYEPSWVHDFTEIDSTFNSVQIFNHLFKGKVKRVIAFPTGYFFIKKQFAKEGYKFVYDKDEHIRQDIVDEIEYYFTIPYSFDIMELDGVEVFDGIDKEPYQVLVLNGRDESIQFF
jgi:hypothetical protein